MNNYYREKVFVQFSRLQIEALGEFVSGLQGLFPTVWGAFVGLVLEKCDCALRITSYVALLPSDAQRLLFIIDSYIVVRKLGGDCGFRLRRI